MQEVKRVKILSVAKISLLTGVLFGLIIGILVAVASSMTSADQLSSAGIPSFLSGPLAIIALPIFYGIMYFVVGIISAAIYNLFAKMVGGVQIDLVAKK